MFCPSPIECIPAITNNTEANKSKQPNKTKASPPHAQNALGARISRRTHPHTHTHTEILSHMYSHTFTISEHKYQNTVGASILRQGLQGRCEPARLFDSHRATDKRVQLPQ